MAVALVSLAAPRMMAGIVAGPFDDTMRSLGRGQIQPDSRWLRLAEASREHALAWYGTARFESDLGALHYAEALGVPRGDQARLDLVAQALTHDRRAIALAPSQPFAWTRIAQGRLEHEGAGADIAAPLAMSYRTAPADPRLLMTRLEIALAVWDRLPDEVRAQTSRQIVLAMDWYPRQLVDLAARRYRQAVVREALAADPVARMRFNIMYLRKRFS